MINHAISHGISFRLAQKRLVPPSSSELIKTQITERVAELSAPALPEGEPA